MQPEILEKFSDANPRITARLKERHKRIIDANADAFASRVVLDIAANNGRWSYASVMAGASKVISIEGREDRVDDALSLFTELGVGDRIETNVGDMYEFLRSAKGRKVDTVLCLGIYYHVMDHYMLLQHMADLEPETIIIDSGFVRSFRNSVQINVEDPSAHSNALVRFSGQKHELVGIVSLGMMIQMAWNVGYSCRPILWDPAETQDRECVQDYMVGRRYTLRLDRMDGHHDADWMDAWRQALVALNPSFEGLLDRKTHDAQSDARVKQPFQSMQFTVL